MPKILFGDDSDDDKQTEKEELFVNTSYAKQYDQFRRREEFQKLKDKYGDVDEDFNSESSSSSEDDYVEPDNPDFDGEFYKVMSALKSRDPGIQEKKFFTQSYAIPSKKEDKEKPMTIRDMERKRLIESGGHFDESDDELKGFEKSVGEDMKSKQRREAKGREGMANVVGFADDGIGGSGDEDDNLLTKEISDTKKLKKKSKPPDEVVAWKTKDKSEKWLKNFFVKKRYLDSDDDEVEGDELDHFVDEETISEDEETLDKMDDFASKYNFRYLEPDGHTIRSYPREITGSLREKSNKRKEQRETTAARKLEQKETRRQEIMQLKMMKQREILDKIDLLKEISGNDNIDGLVKELKEDFDCEKHDAAMKSMFSADYYDGKEDNDQKPIFPNDDDMYNDYDDWMEKDAKAKKNKEESQNGDEGTADFPNPDENVDADHSEDVDDSALSRPSTSKKNKPKLAEILAQEKRPFDPSKESFESYYDEYYKLEFEDIVAGMPVRFNYKTVGANSFGLTTEEILSCRDAELNKWYSINKILRHDRNQGDEMDDEKNYSARSKMKHIKYKYLPSLFSEAPEEELAAEMEKKRLKNRDKKQRLRNKKQALIDGVENIGDKDDKLQNDGTAEFDGVESAQDAVEGGSNTKLSVGKSMRDPKVIRGGGVDNRKRKHISSERGVSTLSNWEKKMRTERLKSNTFLDGISDARLKAMGANPKRVRSKVKYKALDKANE